MMRYDTIGKVAGVAELADARDLKSLVPKERTGSSPVSGTNKINGLQRFWKIFSKIEKN